MIFRNAFIVGFLALGLFSCSEASNSEEKKEVEVSNESDQESEVDNTELAEEKEAPIIVSFTENSKFTITKKNVGLNEATGTDNFDVYLNNKVLSAPIKLGRELSVLEIELGTSGVPKKAVFAYNTWFAGGGEVYYGVVKNGILQVFRKFEDEGMTEEGKFHLFREIDPNVQTKNPDAYITYDSDSKSSKQLMIAFSEDGKALYAKYYGQARHLQLKFVKDASEGRNIIDYYDEIIGDEVVGTYKLTHSGNWDYVEYTRKKDGKKFKFTINHDVTIEGDTYRTTPSL